MQKRTFEISKTCLYFTVLSVHEKHGWRRALCQNPTKDPKSSDGARVFYMIADLR